MISKHSNCQLFTWILEFILLLIFPNSSSIVVVVDAFHTRHHAGRHVPAFSQVNHLHLPDTRSISVTAFNSRQYTKGISSLTTPLCLQAMIPSDTSTIDTLATTSTNNILAALNDEASSTFVLQLWQNQDTWIFLLGIFPFLWATIEFWRRIILGKTFGTGSDQIIIGFDDKPTESRGRRILGRGALITAYILFIIAFGTIGIVLYSVISSTPPTSSDLTTGTITATTTTVHSLI